MTEHSTASPEVTQATPPSGVSGKRVTTWVVAALVTVGVAISFTLWTYNRLDAVRADSATAWRETTHALSDRYRAAEQQVAEAVASGALDADFQQSFEVAVDRFRTTSIAVDQVAAAERVEELLGSSSVPAEVLQAIPPTEQLNAQLDQYNQQRLRERVLRNSFGGKMLELFLSLPASTPFRLSTVP